MEESPLTPLDKGGKDEEVPIEEESPLTPLDKGGKDEEGTGKVPLNKGDLGGFSSEQIAVIHYELWKLTDDASHRDKAMEMYRALYEKTPNYEYKKRMEELSASD